MEKDQPTSASGSHSSPSQPLPPITPPRSRESYLERDTRSSLSSTPPTPVRPSDDSLSPTSGRNLDPHLIGLMDRMRLGSALPHETRVDESNMSYIPSCSDPPPPSTPTPNLLRSPPTPISPLPPSTPSPSSPLSPMFLEGIGRSLTRRSKSAGSNISNSSNHRLPSTSPLSKKAQLRRSDEFPGSNVPYISNPSHPNHSPIPPLQTGSPSPSSFPSDPSKQNSTQRALRFDELGGLNISSSSNPPHPVLPSKPCSYSLANPSTAASSSGSHSPPPSQIPTEAESTQRDLRRLNQSAGSNVPSNSPPPLAPLSTTTTHSSPTLNSAQEEEEEDPQKKINVSAPSFQHPTQGEAGEKKKK